MSSKPSFAQIRVERVDPIFRTYNVRSQRGFHMRNFTTGRECAVVELTGDEYDTAWMAEKWVSSKKSHYGSPKPYKGPVKRYQGIDMKGLYGNMGELAWGKLSGLPVDLEYRVGGDQYDFLIGDMETDIKMAFPKPERFRARGPSILAVIDFKREKPKDLYIAGFIDKDDPAEQHATVVFAGYIGKDELVERPLVASKYGNAQNYDIWFYEMALMRDILT